ncbi:MAG TPA: glycosyltransferase family 4 protein [Bryobacteraceae bacterium]
MRILYIQASFVPPPQDVRADRFIWLSDTLEGDVLHPLWFSDPKQVEDFFGPGSYPSFTRSRFRYRWFLGWRYNGWRRKFGQLWFYIREGRRIYRENKYDCIVAYSHLTPALVGIVLKWLTGARLIVEIMIAPELNYLYENPRRSFSDRLRRIWSDLCLRATALASDRTHLLYKTQLAHYPALRRLSVSVFHDFVAVSLVPKAAADPEPVVLLVGAPWFRKGADVLLAAFRQIADEFPGVRLAIQGHFPEGTLQALAAGAPRVEILRAAPNPETLERISRALVFVLPSRCEGFSRVLIEALASGVPVIASDAGDNAHCVRDCEAGLVFPGGNIDALATCLRQLLSDVDLRKRLADNGYRLAHAELSEAVYAREFTRMIQETVG